MLLIIRYSPGVFRGRPGFLLDALLDGEYFSVEVLRLLRQLIGFPHSHPLLLPPSPRRCSSLRRRSVGVDDDFSVLLLSFLLLNSDTPP